MLTDPVAPGDEYLVGAGMHDITGPAAGVVMMGFAVPSQKTSGIHMRLRARAIIVGDGERRVAIVCADLGMLFQKVKLAVTARLAKDRELSRFYDERNVLLAATHTHGGPGGYSGYLLYDAPTKGFVPENFETIVNGITEAIRRAHESLRPGRVLINEGVLEGVGGNRAQEAYAGNPAAERALYDGDTDRTFTVLRLVGRDGAEIGMINWFGIHPDSIGPGNTLITGDNKGLAAYLFEKDKNADYLARSTFVAAFAQASAGDVTPNIGFGQAPPEVTLAKNRSLANAALLQYEKAKELYESATEPLTGSVDSRHEWVDMRSLHVESAGATTAPAAMGASFSAGSPFDNPSPMYLFPNGTTVDSLRADNKSLARKYRLLSGLGALLWPGSRDAAFRASHAEKPILVAAGIPLLKLGQQPMSPQVLPLQVLKLGSLAVVGVPCEVTTMAGRRFKRAVLDELACTGVTRVVVSSLANSYASYLATREEYAKQWYEGACTQFGPHQQAAFQQELVNLGRAIVRGEDASPGPVPREAKARGFTLTRKVWFDAVPPGKRFGDVLEGPEPAYLAGQTVTVRFWGGHPSNDFRIQDTFLRVERIDGDRTVAVARDWDPETTYRWERRGLARSVVTITWDTTAADQGTYRIVHTGDRKAPGGKISPYEGATQPFVVSRRPR